MVGNNYNNNYNGQPNYQNGFDGNYGQPQTSRAQVMPYNPSQGNSNDPYGLTNNIVINKMS